MRLPPRPYLLVPLGKWIEGQRLSRGWSQAELATYSRLSRGTVSNLEAARHLPMRRRLAMLLQQLRALEDSAAGIELPVLRAPRYSPSRAMAEARRVLAEGGLYDAAWAFVEARVAGAWAMACSKDDIRIAELQAPMSSLVEALQARHGGGLEEVVVLGCGMGHQLAELLRLATPQLPLASVCLVDTSHTLLHYAERAVGAVADSLSAACRRRLGNRGVKQGVLGVFALCADYRDLAMVQPFFGERRAPAYSRLVVLGSSALDHALDDWRDLGAAAACAPAAGDLVLIEHRGGLDDPPDPIERALADWWRLTLREAAREVDAVLVQAPQASDPLTSSPSVCALASAGGEHRVAQLRSKRNHEVYEVRLPWRRAYETEALDVWMAAQGLQRVGRWPYRFGTRCWALYERAPLPAPAS